MLIQSVFGQSLFALLLHAITKEITHISYFSANAPSSSIFPSSEVKYKKTPKIHYMMVCGKEKF